MLSVSTGMYRERPDSREGQISRQWLNLSSCFMSEGKGMSESPVETLEKAVGSASSGQGESCHFDTSRGTRNSMLQKVRIPYSS